MKIDRFAEMIREAARRDAAGDPDLLEGIAKHLAEVEEMQQIFLEAGLRHTRQPMAETAKDVVSQIRDLKDHLEYR